MIKKIFIVFSVISIILFSFSYSYCDDEIEEEIELSDEILASVETCEDPSINSRIAVVLDRESGEVVWGKDENKKTAMASTTKIMTAIIVCENANLDDIVEVSAKAAGTGGSRLGLKKNDNVSVRDLLYGLMLKSGNDAAVALAEYVGGSVEGFTELMNNKAKALKLNNTHFITPHGLDDPEHYTTAKELAIITDYALKNEIIKKIVGTKNYTITINGYPKALTNTNELLGNVNGVYGVKTGFTGNAGRCLVTAINRNDMDIIVIVLQADTKKDRSKDSVKIIDYIYGNYSKVNIKEIFDEEFYNWKNINRNRIEINKSKGNSFDIESSPLKNENIIAKNSDLNNIKIEFDSIFKFESPVEKGRIIGIAKCTVGDKNVDNVYLYTDRTVKKMYVMDYLIYFFEKAVFD